MAQIVRHYDESLEVSEELGIPQSVISRLLQRFQDDGNVSRCYSTGRPRVTTPNEDRYLAATAKRNRRSTASDLFRQLSSATGTTVSRQTLYRCFYMLTSPGLACSLILAGLYDGERQVPVTTKRTPLNDTVTVVKDGLFGEELFLVPELTCMFRV
ncbi:HTH_Tnp_Tc3_2 domain-containing protein [Trichonephila clavipes]|nr:HTH_Tnp_Tc3_2 domain-containing protein [Trichonephila clavipes]